MARSTVSHATETSPLLSGTTVEQPEGLSSNDCSGEDGGDIERQTSNETSEQQGMPEVKKRMKYIFPAITIGVSTRCD
jgi:hypothetical protein